MKTKWFFIVGFLLLALTACGAQPVAAEAQPIPIPTLTPLPPPTATDAAPLAETPAVESSAPAAEVSFARDVAPIFADSCVECHGGAKTRAGLDLTSYVGLMSGSQEGAVIFPGNPQESVLLQQVVDGAMPKRGPKLPPEKIEVISDWIAAGAPNN
jgi:mono/diheme cytochrome c family protein